MVEGEVNQAKKSFMGMPVSLNFPGNLSCISILTSQPSPSIAVGAQLILMSFDDCIEVLKLRCASFVHISIAFQSKFSQAWAETMLTFQSPIGLRCRLLEYVHL
jgi:hypothetical protein